MIIEIIIIICVVAIFILLARRLPDIINKTKKTVSMESPVENPVRTHDFWKEDKIDLENKSNFEIGDSYFEKGNYREAEKHYIKAASENPNNAKIYNRLGIIYLEQKNYRDAKDAFGELLKLDDKKPSRHINFGLACLNLKNYDEAIKSFENAIKIDPKNPKYQELLKEAKSKKKLFEKK